MRFVAPFVSAGIAVSASMLAACTPALNWRELPVGSAVVMLPCKPETDSRAMDLPTGSATLTLHGCAAAGATFVVGHLALPTTATDAQVESTLRAWQQAALLPFRANAAPGTPAPHPGAVNAQAITVQAQGQDRQGQPLQLRGQWLAHRSANGVTALQRLVIAPKLEPAAAQAFFEGPQWR